VVGNCSRNVECSNVGLGDADYCKLAATAHSLAAAALQAVAKVSVAQVHAVGHSWLGMEVEGRVAGGLADAVESSVHQ